MAKADDGHSTPPHGGTWFTDHFHQYRLHHFTPCEALQLLTTLIRYYGVEVSPPLPPEWHVALGPEDEVLFMTPEGIWGDGRQVSFRLNMLKAVPPTPREQAAIETMSPEPSPALPPPPAPPPPSPAPASPPPPPPRKRRGPPPPPSPAAVARVDTQVWFSQALKDHEWMPGEKPIVYARRLHALMRKAPVTEQWAESTVRRRLGEEMAARAKSGKPARPA